MFKIFFPRILIRDIIVSMLLLLESVIAAKPDRKNETTVGRVALKANYFRLTRKPNWIINRYHVTFEPIVESIRFRSALIAQHKPTVGTYLFDGMQLFTVRRLVTENDEVSFVSKSREEQEYTIKLKHTGEISAAAREFTQILNLVQRRATNALKLQLVGRNYYDPNCKVSDFSRISSHLFCHFRFLFVIFTYQIDLKQFQLELWPGFDTSIRLYSNNMLLLNCDVVHKVMRTDTVYDMMCETKRSDSSNFRDNFQKKVLGITVLTGYNNKTYRIDDVDYIKSPMSTFTRREGEITIAAYYAEVISISII